MPTNAVVRARIDERTKEEASAVRPGRDGADCF